MPDIDKILQLSCLFGVTTDYLLKTTRPSRSTPRTIPPLPWVTLAQANDYLAKAQANAPRLALATALCVVSPIPLLALVALSEAGLFGIWDDLAGGIGPIALLVIIAAAVAIFMQCRASVRAYEFCKSRPLRLSTASPALRRSAATPLRRSTTRPTSSARCSAFVGGAGVCCHDGWCVVLVSASICLVLALVARRLRLCAGEHGAGCHGSAVGGGRLHPPKQSHQEPHKRADCRLLAGGGRHLPVVHLRPRETASRSTVGSSGPSAAWCTPRW